MATKNTTAPCLEVKGIRKTFGQNAVLKGINLSVDAGEVVALIGGNGAAPVKCIREYSLCSLFHKYSPSISHKVP